MSFSLFLYAENSKNFDRSTTQLTDYLQEIDFIANQTRSLPLKVGCKLMDFITFLGCSPALQRGEIESSISIHQFNQLTGLGGKSITTIRYPGCKHPVDEPENLVRSYPGVKNWKCPVCGIEGKTDEIQWRKSAGFSTVFIEISQVFPKEAVPSDKLLIALNKFTHHHWQWFYSTTTFQ